MEPMEFEDFEGHLWDQAGRIASEAYELYEKGQMTEALNKMVTAIAMNPSCGAWHFNVGLTLDALERYEEAIDCYEKALELCGEDIEILNSLGVDYTRTCQYDRALAIFEKIESIDPNYEPCYCNRIITYTEMDQHENAEQMFYLAQQINPDCPICFYNIGNSLFSRGMFDRAVWCWKKTAQLDPNHPQISHRIAQACWVGGKTEEAREYFLKEIRKNPGCIEVIFDFGLFLLETGDFEGGLEKFNRIIELQADFAPAWFYRGEVLHGRGESERAEKDYRRATELDRELPGPHFRLAQIAFEKGRYEEAVSHSEDELRLEPEDVSVMLSIGWMLSRLGEFDMACRCFMTILEKDRQNDNAGYGLGLCMAARKNYRSALQFLNFAISQSPQNPDYQIALIWLHIHLKEWESVSNELATFRTLFGQERELRGIFREIKLHFLVEKWKEKLLSHPWILRGPARWPFLRKYFE